MIGSHDFLILVPAVNFDMVPYHFKCGRVKFKLFIYFVRNLAIFSAKEFPEFFFGNYKGPGNFTE